MAGKGQAAKPRAATKPAKPIMTDAGIAAKTGHGWDWWFAALDKAGAAELDHKGITALLDRKFKPGPWWGQMIAVSYERAPRHPRRQPEMRRRVLGRRHQGVPGAAGEALRGRDGCEGMAQMVAGRRIRGDFAHRA